MKNSYEIIVLLFILLVLPIQMIYAQDNQLPERTVLLEVFTGTWCGWCPYGADVVKELESKYDYFIPISYHYNDEMEIEQLNGLLEIIRPGGYPMAAIDRVRDNENRLTVSRNIWEQQILAQREKSSPISLELEASYNHDTKEIDIAAVICSYDDFYAELRLNVIVIEDSLNYKQKIYDKPYTEIYPYYHMNVVRQTATGTIGVPLNNKPLKKQICIKKDINFKLNEEIVPENSSIVVFIHENQSNGFGKIYQAAKIPVIDDINE